MKYYLNPIDSLFNDIFATWTDNGKKIPPVDVYETKDSYVIEAEVAGYNQEDIDLQVDKHILKISAKEVKRAKDVSIIANEISLPSFERSFSLPEGSDEERINADYKNGILVITIPKAEKALPKRITVKIN